MRLLLLTAVLALVAAGCRIPEDPEGTLDRVQGGTMRVGLTEADPWVTLDPPGGVEVELVRRFARDLRARVDWVEGSEEELVGALKEGSLDLVIGGLTSKSRWNKDVALTRPYLETKTLIGVPSSGPVLDDLDGVRVAAELGSEEHALAERKTDAEVFPVTNLSSVRGPAAVHDFLLDDLDLHATEFELKQEKHVLALRFGENAWMVRLERFLLNREDEIRRLLRMEARP